MLIPDDFQRVFKQGRKQKGALFTLFCYANGKIQARLGLAVAKRHVPSAVNRNRIRRLIRESFRYYQSQISGNDVVVVITRQFPKVSNQILQEELNQQWQKLMRSLQGFS
ncbi:MAG: ribonuclease P protein component [Proteobacteria bacterium]|nr:ribonuclease P protein component [Pseudomonadota bacterium]